MEQPLEANSTASWLFNPFSHWERDTLFWAGMGILLLHIPVGYFLNVRFDGAIDMHLVGSVDSVGLPLLDTLISWGTMVACLYLLAKLFQSRIQLADIAGSVAIARIPLLLSIIPAKLFLPEAEELEYYLALEGWELIMLLIISLIILLFFAWFLVMLFNAYESSSGLKGAKLWSGFIGGILIAEVVSIMLLQLI